MPICIECRYPVPQLYHTSTSSKPGGGGGAGAASGVSGAAASSHTSGAAHGSGANSFVASALVQAPASHSHSSTSGGSAPEEAAAPRATGSVPVKRSRGGGEAARRGPAGGDVRLTQCPRCKRFADKYVEHDFVVLFIDLVLVKPQVYRHLLFNRLGSDDDQFDPAITRLGTLLLLFDVYLTWSHIESLPTSQTGGSGIPRLPILAQYTFYLVLCAAATLAQHLTIRLLARTFASPTHSHASAPSASGSRWGIPLPAAHSGATTPTPTPGGGSVGGWSPVASFHSVGASNLPNTTSSSVPNTPTTHATQSSHAPQPPPQGWGSSLSATPAPSGPTTHVRSPGPNAVSTALFVSSCMQLFPILMVVWKYDDQGGQLTRGVSWAVGAQNVEALRILLGKTYPTAASLVAAGALARYVAKRLVLGLVGLGFAA